MLGVVGGGPWADGVTVAELEVAVLSPFATLTECCGSRSRWLATLLPLSLVVVTVDVSTPEPNPFMLSLNVDMDGFIGEAKLPLAAPSILR